MSDIISTRQRLLALREIFITLTDVDNQLSIDEIIEKLKVNLNLQIDFEIKNKIVLKQDIKALQDSGFKIIENVAGRGKKYYSHQERPFELYELRMFIDAICSARFITTKDSNELIHKIKKLASVEQARMLINQLVLDKHTKTENPQMKYDLDRLHRAISEGHNVSFQYGNYNLDKEFHLHREGAIYFVEPYAQVWNQDYYYLIGKHSETKSIRHYRVDRMRNVTVVKERKELGQSFHIGDYLQKTFHMYPGEERMIQIQFKNQLINVMIDRFGREVDIRRVNEEYFVLKTKVAVSEGLKRWILTWGADAKVLSPPTLVDEMKVEIAKMTNHYS